MQKTRTQIQTEINNEVVSNNDRGITALMLNNIFTDINDSAINKFSDTFNLGLYEFNISENYNLNQCVVYDRQIWKANTNVNAGTFSYNQWDVIQNETKCVFNFIGNTSSTPTIYRRFDNLFLAQPSITRSSTGQYNITFNTNVFNGTYSIDFGAWDDGVYLPTHPIAININTNSMDLIVYNHQYDLIDLFRGYLTITQY
jgi:hypothetical protein